MGYTLVGPCYTRGMGDKVVNIRVRFPEEVRDRVKVFADRDRRSLNSEILALLEEAMNARKPAPPPTSEG